ncbi:PREDICTED: glycoprotein Xg isoform X2 [Chinchilla lanigera]|uniref:glycoprotein Xg isoform X2 n=1 Tax=Chinchilla lanigera TaxID=34839 RepID=UPI000698140F|nr:PREDICTED: glycoprotein Xg isoform X2 [Chinchilla lanigera]
MKPADRQQLLEVSVSAAGAAPLLAAEGRACARLTRPTYRLRPARCQRLARGGVAAARRLSGRSGGRWRRGGSCPASRCCVSSRSPQVRETLTWQTRWTTPNPPKSHPQPSSLSRSCLLNRSLEIPVVAEDTPAMGSGATRSPSPGRPQKEQEEQEEEEQEEEEEEQQEEEQELAVAAATTIAKGTRMVTG